MRKIRKIIRRAAHPAKTLKAFSRLNEFDKISLAKLRARTEIMENYAKKYDLYKAGEIQFGSLKERGKFLQALLNAVNLHLKSLKAAKKHSSLSRKESLQCGEAIQSGTLFRQVVSYELAHIMRVKNWRV